MHAMYKDLLPPTDVDICLEARFTSPTAVNLIVSKAYMLQVFNVIEEDAPAALKDSDDSENVIRPKKIARLELAGEFRLMGVITSMTAVRTPNSVGHLGIDSLLLTFKDAKMTLIEYSSSTQSIVTVSLHYYERDEFKKDALTDKGVPQVRVDPQYRCASLNFFNDRLAILPFKQDVDNRYETEESAKYPFHPSFVLQLSSIDPNMTSIIDFAFLYDFFEPTLAILYEVTPTWTGRLAARRDTCSVIVISLSTTQKTHTVLYQVNQLPYNCFRIMPIPFPVGGLLVFSPNALIHFDQTSNPGLAVAVNGFFGMETSLPAPPSTESLGPPARLDNPLYKKSNYTDLKHLGLTLEGCVAELVNPDTVLVVLRSGELVLVEMVGNADAGSGWRRKKSGVKKFKVDRMGFRTVMPFATCRIGGGGPSKGFFTAGKELARCLGGLGGVGQGFEPRDVSYFYVLVASRTTDTHLLQISDVDGVQTKSLTAPTPNKPSYKPTTTFDDDDDDLYGEKDSAMHDIKNSDHSLSQNQGTTRYRIRVCDIIQSTGPIRDMAVGEPSRYADESYAGGLRKELEVVACTGEGVVGSLGILQKNLRPKIITSVEVSEVNEVWSIRCSSRGNLTEFDYHDYLIMSKDVGTTVLQTGEDLQEIQDRDFYRDGPTVYIGSLCDDTMILQIHPNGVLLLNAEGKKKFSLPIGDEDTWIVSCSVADPYIVLMLNIGDVLMLKVEDSYKQVAIIKSLRDTAISSVSLYVDLPQNRKLPLVGELRQKTSSLNGAVSSTSAPTTNGTTTKRKRVEDDDDDDDDLYGDSEPVKNTQNNDAKSTDDGYDDSQPKVKQHYCLFYKEDGSLEIINLPSFEQVYFCEHFDFLYNIIYDDFNPQPPTQKKEEFSSGADIAEILPVKIGRDGKRDDLYLLARTEQDDLIIYKAVPHLEDPKAHPSMTSAPLEPQVATSPFAETPVAPPHRISVRFIRVPHDHFSRTMKRYSDTEGDKLNSMNDAGKPPSFIKKSYLRPFTRVGGASGGLSYTGVFMSGSRPCWIMMAREGSSLPNIEALEGVSYPDVAVDPPLTQIGKGVLRIHPCLVDGEILTFTEFHNVNIPDGFVYVTKEGMLRLCQLLWQFNYDGDWAYCKVPLKRTPHKITYHHHSETYTMAASVPTPFILSKAQHAAAVAAGVLDADSKPEITEKPEERVNLYYPQVGSYSLELISPVTWETVDRYPMDDYEQVLTCSAVDLQSKETASGLKLFLAVGTGVFRGEDLATRGRVLIFDIIEVVPEIDKPQTKNKFKHLCTNDEKSPVTAIGSVNGYLLAAIGTRVIIHSFEDGESLVGVAFVDANIFVQSVSSIKNLILIADISKSVMFAGFQEDPPQVKMFGKDYYPLQVYGSEFVVYENMAGFVVGDGEKNLHLMTYAPYNIQSLRGQKLLRKGDLHVGSTVQRIVRLRRLPNINDKTTKPLEHFNICGTLEGGISTVVPVSEKMYKRLYALYSKMVNTLQHHAGLNPRGFRQVQQKYRPLMSSATTGPPGPRSILDGDLLYKYASLSVLQQRELAKGVGSTVERIMDDLVEMAHGTEYF
ncbi:Cleavage and polyadenylation specificity factor subunit 1 [Chytridiales sp. JEL 0842]|nr:Cleavage and polyadenylation specificity factor subunit 1 [Chytridiales sp. JEL 0842]